jgi:hypothetical protein
MYINLFYKNIFDSLSVMGIYSKHNYFFIFYLMPNFDGTGPTSVGSMTGQGKGACIAQRGSESFGHRGGCRRGGGVWQRNRRGQGVCFQEVSLEEQEKMLKEQLAIVREAIKKDE